jgi:gingipain R
MSLKRVFKRSASLLSSGKRMLVLSGAFGLFATANFAEWQPLVRGSQKVEFSVNRMQRSLDQNVSVTVPGYYLETKVVDGKTYSVITVPGYPGLTEQGNPDVPRIGANFLSPDYKAPEVSVVSSEYADIKLEHPLLPSKGHLTRDIDPETVPYTFSDVYEQDAFFPDRVMAEVSDPFIIHNVNGVNVNFNLFQYNPVTQTLRVHKNVEVKVQNGAENRTLVKKSVPQFVNNVVSRSFVNYSAMSEDFGLQEADEKGRMLVICFDDFAEAAQPFVDWKVKSGIPTKMVKMSEVGKTADDVKAFVKAEFEAGGLSFLHLVGDVEQIPTLRGTVERAHSDQSYGLLAGDDWYLDIIVSRFSAKTAEKVAYQVAKTINYEKSPETGENAGWYKKGVGIASNEGNPPDWDYSDKLRDALLGFTYDEIDKIYDPGAKASDVAAAVNAGRSVINYIGHGSKTSWGTTRFSNSDIVKLTNGNKLPYIWSVACVNGAFAESYDSFAETWMNAGGQDDVKGAVAIAAASTNMQWIPPLHWQAEINVVLLPAGGYSTFGGLSLQGMSKIAEVYGPTNKSFKMFVEQTNNFGDGSLKIRYDVPAKVSVKSLELRDGKVNAVVVSEEGRSTADLTIAVYDKEMTAVRYASTNERGEAVVDFSDLEGKELVMTVTGNNIVPIVDVTIPLALQKGQFEAIYE